MISKEDIEHALKHIQTIVPKETVVKVLEELKQKHLEELTKTSFGFYLVEDLNKALELIHEEKKKPVEVTGGAIAVNFSGGVGFNTEVQPKPALVAPRKQAVHKASKRPVSKRV